MKSQPNPSLINFPLLKQACPEARAPRKHGQRSRFLTRAAFGGVAVGLLALGTLGYARESVNWNLYSGMHNQGDSNTNGAPVTDSLGDPGYAGTVNATLSQSDLFVGWSGGPTTYGVSTSAGSWLDLWAYNQPGQTGPIYVTVTPYVFVRSWHATPTSPGGYVADADVYCSLETRRNGVAMYKGEFATELSGRDGISVQRDTLRQFTLTINDGDSATIIMSHSDGASVNYWLSANASSVAWYTVGVSGNGYLSLDSRLPANPTLPVLPPIQPQCTTVALTDVNHTQMTVTGTGGPTLAPLPYYVMTSTNIATPLANWTPYLTNNFATNGSFTFSFPITPGEPQRFFKLQMTR